MAKNKLGRAIFIVEKLEFIANSIKLSKESFVTVLKGSIHNEYVNGC